MHFCSCLWSFTYEVNKYMYPDRMLAFTDIVQAFVFLCFQMLWFLSRHNRYLSCFFIKIATLRSCFTGHKNNRSARWLWTQGSSFLYKQQYKLCASLWMFTIISFSIFKSVGPLLIYSELWTLISQQHLMELNSSTFSWSTLGFERTCMKNK